MKRLYCVENEMTYFRTDDYLNFDEETENFKFAVIGRDWEYAFSEYTNAAKNFDYFIEDFETIESDGHGSYGEIVNYYFPKANGRKYSPKEIKRFKELYKRVEGERKFDFLPSYACEIMELITGHKYAVTEIKGYSQGDRAELIHPCLQRDFVEYIEACAFDTGTEYTVYEIDTPEKLTAAEISDFFDPSFYAYTDYTAEWGEAYRSTKAKEHGISRENVIVYRIKDYKRTSTPIYEAI